MKQKKYTYIQLIGQFPWSLIVISFFFSYIWYDSWVIVLYTVFIKVENLLKFPVLYVCVEFQNKNTNKCMFKRCLPYSTLANANDVRIYFKNIQMSLTDSIFILNFLMHAQHTHKHRIRVEFEMRKWNEHFLYLPFGEKKSFMTKFPSTMTRCRILHPEYE